MPEKSTPDVGAQPFGLMRLCKYSYDLSPQPMVAVEGTTHIVRYLNTAFERLVGKTRAELIGHPFAEAVPEGETNGCLALLDRAYRTKQPEILAEQEHSQASPSYWSYSVWAILGPDEGVEKPPVGVMIQVTNATDVALFRKQVVAMNEQLLISATRQHELTEKAEKANQSTEIAEKANQAKSEFLSRMSHELRTPLNAILGFGQILEAQDLTARQKESVGHILKGGWHLLGLINEVLDITSIEKGEAKLSLEPISLADIVPDLCSLVRPLAAQRNIRLQQNVSALAPISVLADLRGLKQVLINLLSNAIKYNREGGQVTVSCHPRPNGRLQITVSDTGPGITAEDLPKLFTPFERLHAAQLGIQGTGLGLVLSQGLVKAMGGDLEVESVLGQGSTFCIELPQATTSKASLESSAST